MNFIQKNLKGILLCIAIAVPSWFLGKYLPIIGGPVFSILIGMIITLFFKSKDNFQAGINFTSKKILQYAVILLGFGLNLSVILSTGKQSLPIIITTISTSLIIAFLLHKMMNISSKISTLIGVGSSICGGSAIAATAPVIDADDDEVAQSISVIFLFNVIAALIFPTLGTILGMSTEGFGLFAGTAINDTSSVTAAATAWDGIHKGSNALDIATIVKLTRTLAIIPITLTLAFFRTRKEKALNSKVNIKKIFPFFIIYFLFASVITTIFNLSPEMTEPIKELSKFFIIMAMSAIGLNTNIVKLIKNGGKPIFMGLCCWIGITIVSILMQLALDIL
nr:YeiH family protein [uncultured Aminipila sp.]